MHEMFCHCVGVIVASFVFFLKLSVTSSIMSIMSPSSTLCIRTLVEHSGRVFRLQFDEFQIVSSSHDDTILIWDFLNCTPPEKSSPQRSYTYVSNF